MKYSVSMFVAAFPFLAESVDPACLGGSNGHFLKRLNGGEQAAIKAAYEAFEGGQLMLANHPELLAECEKLLPNYGWKNDALVCAFLTGRLGRVNRAGLVATGGTTVLSLGSKAVQLKDKLFQQLVYGGAGGQAARNEGEIYIAKYDAATGKRFRPTVEAIAAAVDAAIETAFTGDDSPTLVDVPTEMSAAPEVVETANDDAVVAAIAAISAELAKPKLSKKKRAALEAQRDALIAQTAKSA